MNALYLDLNQAFLNAGLTPPDRILVDGKLHRYAQPDKPKSVSSWYVFFDSGSGVTGVVGDWRTGLSANVSTWRDKSITQTDMDAAKAMMAQARAHAKKARKAEQDATARRAVLIWNNTIPANQNHQYLKRKCLPPFGLREASGNLIIPITDIDNVLWSIQTIKPNGEKRFLSGGRTKDCMSWIEGKRTDTLYIAEGWATAASVAFYTTNTAACAFNAGNMTNVATAIRKKYPNVPIVIVADHDEVGIKAAKQAASKTGADFWYPPTQGHDFNDWMIESGVMG
ncbi:toprim domain-containing protein [Zhongshania sp. BJYM1]|uniref:toprim domain-containing protein n=1 Tax=Zhongshania aquatica TaxID=2965069 RepID=UPI0022B3B896|nr:toprim domain-containing protein [Marortus sp. BJYM1]